MNKYLKQEIFNWLIENENEWQRTNECHNNFKEYIYNSEGNFLKYGGRDVSDFIIRADRLIYGGDKNEL